MKTISVVLDSSQGVGTPSNFVVKLNENVRGCVYSMLRQVILNGANPTGDYIYIRSSKLGSNIVSAQGFGAFDVVPFVRSSIPFVYERYEEVANPDEFECGRLLDSIDIAFVNADNTPVDFTIPSFSVTKSKLLTLYANNTFSDAALDPFGNLVPNPKSFDCLVSPGIYSANELALAMTQALNKSAGADTRFRFKTEVKGGKMEVYMDWSDPDTETGLGRLDDVEYFKVRFESFYNDPSANESVVKAVVSDRQGNLSMREFADFVGAQLSPTFETLLTSDNCLQIHHNWTPLSGPWMKDAHVFDLNIVADFTSEVISTGPLAITLPRRGAYSFDELASALDFALQPVGRAIASKFKDNSGTTGFDVKVNKDGTLDLTLDLHTSNFVETIEYTEPTRLFDSVGILLELSNGTSASIQTPPGYISPGTYTRSNIVAELKDSMDVVVEEMFKDGFNKAEIRECALVDDNENVEVRLDWTNGKYDQIELPSMNFVIEVKEEERYHRIFVSPRSWPTRNGVRPRPDLSSFGIPADEPLPAGYPNPEGVEKREATYRVNVNIPEDSYTLGTLFQRIQNQILADTSVPSSYKLVCSMDGEGRITISTSNVVRYFSPEAGYFNGHNWSSDDFYGNVTLKLIGEGLDILGIPNGTQLTSTNPGKTSQVHFTLAEDCYLFYTTYKPFLPPFKLCPSFPPIVNNVKASFTRGDITEQALAYRFSHLAGCQGSFTWKFPLPKKFHVYKDTRVSVLPPGEEDDPPDPSFPSLRFPPLTQIEFKPGQYRFMWRGITPNVPRLQEGGARLLVEYEEGNPYLQFLGLATRPLTSVDGLTLTFAPLSYPQLVGVGATMSNVSGLFGSFRDIKPGRMIAFDERHKDRRYMWTLLSLSKSVAVVDIITK